MRIIAIILYGRAACFGTFAVLFGDGGLAFGSLTLLLFGLAFHRIAELRTILGLSGAIASSGPSLLAVSLFCVAALAVIASFLLDAPQTMGMGVFFGLLEFYFTAYRSLVLPSVASLTILRTLTRKANKLRRS
jgi:hypothetical protein